MTARELLRKLSELREKLAAETDETKAAAIRAEMATTEAEWRTADEAEQRAADDADESAVETRDHPLVAEIELRNYLRHAATGTRLDGREAELNQELRMDDGAGVRVPWEALLPTRTEQRADTVAPDTVGIDQMAIVSRIFARTAAMFVGVEMPTVGIGESEYVIMTGGTEPKMTAAGAAVAAQTAATFETTVLGPKRLSAEYIVRIEDMARLRGLEDSLRADLRMAFEVAVDQQVFNGQLSADGKSNPEQVRGLYPRFLPSAATGSAPADPTALDVIEAIDGAIDGRLALMRDSIRLAVPNQLNALVAGLVQAQTIDISARYGGNMRVLEYVPNFVFQAKSGASKTDGLSRYALRSLISVPTKAVAPVWQGFDLIRDPYTQAGAGKVVITAHMLWNFDVLRDEAFSVTLPIKTQDRT